MDKPFAIPFFFSHWVSEQREVLEKSELFQSFKIAKLYESVVGEDKRCEIWGRDVDRGRDGRYSVVGE